MYDPKLKDDIAKIMATLGALCLDAADRYDPGDNPEVEKDRATHKLTALRDYDRMLSDRSAELINESLLEQVRPAGGSH